MDNNLDQDHVHNLAVLGQYGIRKLTTGQTSYKGEQFIAVFAKAETEFTADLYAEKGDKIFDDTLAAGTTMELPCENIDIVSGNLYGYLKPS